MKSIKDMSFSEYLAEAGANITPPSGNPITPQSSSSAPKQDSPQQTGPKAYAGKGSPIEVGMQVGIKGPSGTPVPGMISKVDLNGNGVQVKNPTTGKDEWMNIDTLQPFMANNQAPNAQAPNAQVTAEETELKRMVELAGISENCSAGATGAGAIAIAPASMGKVKRRQETDEAAPPKEYTPKEPAKTIVGDTKPHQASGELSANLAARGKKTASRINNGFKR